MYVSAAINFSTMVTSFGESVVSMLQFLSWLDPYMEFMALTEETKETGKELFTGEVETVEFKDVTFTYPNAEAPVLKNISFSIHPGEKISIVGLNGAGKSTLVKLICRMYQADSGKILVNGKNISHRMSSSVFCDRILIIQDGRVADFDTHENLMKKTDSLFYQLFQSQAENYKLEEAFV